jgi:hypothetical protein
VVQQRAGVHLAGGVGQEGDPYEQHADAVAQRVVAGQSAEDLLDGVDGNDQEDEIAADEEEADEAAARPAAAPDKGGAAPAGPGAPVQLRLERATVAGGGGAGLHKSDRKTVAAGAAVTPRRGNTGSKRKVAANAVITVDDERPVTDPAFVWAQHTDKEGYMKRAKLTFARQRILASTYYLVPLPAGGFHLFNTATNQFVNDPTVVLAAGGRQPFIDAFTHVLNFDGGGVTVDTDDVAKALFKQIALGSLPDQALWGQAVGNINDRIIPRVTADHGALVAAGLITGAHQLKDVKFTGADFHKHGQAPFFLYFETANPLAPDRRCVVYKPGNLGVDRRLFGSQPGSVADTLDPGGNAISKYSILTQQQANNGLPGANESYAFMQFVQSDVPRTAPDLQGVYDSLGANMALSYIVGLEDVHQENVLLLRNRVQVIDMEATTGLFGKRDDGHGALDPTRGGFDAQLWLMAINHGKGIAAKLLAAAQDGTLAAAPDTGAATAGMATAFRAVLNRAKSDGQAATMQGHAAALAGMASRVVPIKTEAFYNLIPLAQARAQGVWNTAVDDGAAGHGPLAAVMAEANHQSGATMPFLQRVLKSNGAYNALRRGEVPYFTRALDGTNVRDEEGNVFSGAGFPKIGRAIDTEMEDRRTELRAHGDDQQANTADVYAIFQAQILDRVTDLNNQLRAAILAHAGGGHGGGGH